MNLRPPALSVNVLSRAEIIFECKCAKLWLSDLPEQLRTGMISQEETIAKIEAANAILDFIDDGNP